MSDSSEDEDTEPGWVQAEKGELPKGATEGGQINGNKLYIARGMIDGCWIPGSLNPKDKRLHVAWNKKVYKLKKYQVLVYSDGTFRPMTIDDDIPEDSVVAGQTHKDEEIFVGRVKHDGAIIIGRISPSEEVCHVAYKGKQLAFSDFEILQQIDK